MARLFQSTTATEQRTLSKVFSPLLTSIALASLVFCVADTAKAQTGGPNSGSGLPIPRFVSLKADRVNLRRGPGTDYPTGWVFRRAGLPVEIIKEFDTWRQIRDAEGTTGWVLRTLLSGRRTAIVLPWARNSSEDSAASASVFNSNSSRSRTIAKLEPGVITNLKHCDGSWCRITVENFAGYIEQKNLWGVYENEQIE